MANQMDKPDGTKLIIRGERRNVFLDDVHLNDYNPNRMDERTYESLKESMQDHGIFLDLVVRPHPELPGQWQVVDGEHRYRAITEVAEEQGLLEVPANVIEADDAEAKKLTVIANGTRGSFDKVELAVLLASIEDSGVPRDDLGRALPYAPGELSEMIELAAHKWGEYGDDDPGYDDGPGGDDGGGGFVTVEAAFTDEDFATVEQVRRKIADVQALSGDEPVRWGQVFHALAAEYLGDGRG